MNASKESDTNPLTIVLYAEILYRHMQIRTISQEQVVKVLKMLEENFSIKTTDCNQKVKKLSK